MALLLLVALSMSGLAWWYQHSQTRGVLAHWGAAAAMRIEKAEPVVAYRLVRRLPENPDAAPANSRPPIVTIGQQTYQLEQPVQLTGRRGFLHFRHALLKQTSYDWEAKPPKQPQWEYLLRFGEGTGSFELIIAPGSRAIAQSDGSKIAVLGLIAEKISDYLEQTFTGEQTSE